MYLSMYKKCRRNAEEMPKKCRRNAENAEEMPKKCRKCRKNKIIKLVCVLKGKNKLLFF